ncbi:unnamed protein product, partial [Ectocarpus fasciculatus]
ISLLGVSQWYLEGTKYYGKAGFNQAKSYFSPDDITSLSGKIVAITGANAGLGFATAMETAKLQAEVHLLCRNAVKCEDAKKKIVDATGNTKIYCHTCDVSEMHSIRQFATQFTVDIPRLDVLINNAGCMPTSKTMTTEGHEVIMATMLGGTMLLTDLLLPALRKSEAARVINVSSGGAYSVAPRLQDLDFKSTSKYDGTLFYAVAKRNQILLTEEWRKRLESKNSAIYVTSMHPGWAATEGLQSAMKEFYESNLSTLRSPEEGADTIVFLAANANGKVETNDASFWFDRKPARTTMPLSGTSCGEINRAELWNNAAKYVGGVTIDTYD